MTKPVVALTLGDPAGIGPEIVHLALRRKSVVESARLVIVGDWFVFRNFPRALDSLGRITRCSSPEEIPRARSFPCFYDLGHKEFRIPTGRIDPRCGQVSIDYVKAAVRLVSRNIVEGIVTAPIHKQAWAAAGSRFHGHTELLASLSGTRNFAMAFSAKGFWTVLMSTHLSLKSALSRLTGPQLSSTVELTAKTLKSMGIRKARIAVAGVNPHAGEGGLLGTEEQRIFLPIIRRYQDKGFLISGPHSADTVYLRAAQGEFDAVIAPYHDQAMLAVKTLSFGHATNITLGLPFVRTSVDHGTAFDIAGRGLANCSALVEAIHKCRELILARRKTRPH